MKKLTIALSLTVLLVGCGSNQDAAPKNMVTDENAKVMQLEWCKHNEGRDFAKDQCDGIN